MRGWTESNKSKLVIPTEQRHVGVNDYKRTTIGFHLRDAEVEIDPREIKEERSG